MPIQGTGMPGTGAEDEADGEERDAVDRQFHAGGQDLALQGFGFGLDGAPADGRARLQEKAYSPMIRHLGSFLSWLGARV